MIVGQMRTVLVEIYNILKSESGWVSYKFAGTSIACLGFAADFLKPIFDIMLYMLIASVFVLAVSTIIFYILRKSAQSNGAKKLSARVSLLSMIGVAVFSIVTSINSMVDDKGVISNNVDMLSGLQQTLIDKLDQAQKRQEKSLGKINDSITSLNEDINKNDKKIHDLMDLTTALSIVDRSIALKDGSMQGQSAALESLIQRDFEYVNSNFNGINLNAAKLDKSVFSDSSFHSSDLSNVSATDSNFKQADFRFSNMNNIDLSRSDLSRSFSPFVNAHGANLSSSNMSYGYYSGSNFNGADFREANLKGAYFVFADLRNANFDGADLTDAIIVGSLLNGATFSNSTISNTNILGSVSDEFNFSSVQAAGLCRSTVEIDQWDIELYEKWGSDKYGNGYQSEQMQRWSVNNHVKTLKDKTLPICVLSNKDENNYIVKCDCMSLNRDYLSKANRRSKIKQRVDDQIKLLDEELNPSKVFIGDNSQHKLWSAQLEEASLAVGSALSPMINSDQVLLLLLKNNVIDVDDVNWKKVAKVRYDFETKVRDSSKYALEDVTMYPQLFPDNAPWEDLKGQAEIYKKWVLSRLARTEPKLTASEDISFNLTNASSLFHVFRRGRGEAVPDVIKEINYPLGMVSLGVHGFENGNRCCSWGSSSTSRKFRDFAGDREKSKFIITGLNMWVSGVKRILLATPLALNDYKLLIPESTVSYLRSHENAMIYVTFSIDKIVRVPDQEDTIVLFSKPHEAKIIHDDVTLLEFNIDDMTKIISKP